MAETKKLIAIDINKNEVKSNGIAYYRLPKELKEFFELCEEKNNIVGFEWNGTYNFGVILEEKNKEK
jgi:hypothetical protein